MFEESIKKVLIKNEERELENLEIDFLLNNIELVNIVELEKNYLLIYFISAY